MTRSWTRCTCLTDPEGLAHAMHLLEDTAPLRRANEAILAYIHSHNITRNWGSPFECAADAMSLDMPEYVWYTSPDPKRRVPGAATYVHTHGQQGIFSDRAIMITQRQVGPAIDGILAKRSPRSSAFTPTPTVSLPTARALRGSSGF